VSPRSLPHLVRRFFRSLTARRPGPADQVFIASVLDGGVALLFAAQSPMDQAHALRAARAVAVTVPRRTELVRAALLHDVGKTHAGIGIAGRSCASLLAMAHLPVTRRMRSYLDHGVLGAADLGRAGESGIVVAFAGAHHTAIAPPGADPHDWAALRRADDQ